MYLGNKISENILIKKFDFVEFRLIKYVSYCCFFILYGYVVFNFFC